MEDLTTSKSVPYSVKLYNDNIFISFEINEIKRLKTIISRPYTEKSTREKAKEELKKFNVNSNSKRVLGIDQNPNYIGISIIEFDENDNFEIIYKEVVDFKELNNKENYSKNKKKHELIEICKYIINLAQHYNCSKLSVEELSFKNNNRGKVVNRLCKNVWHRQLLSEQLRKRCEEQNIEYVEVNASYSSFIGNLIHGNDINCPDMVAASIEITRRGFNKFKKGWFYSELKTSYSKNLLKEDLNDCDVESWKTLFAKIKKSKVKYRFSLAENIEFFRHSSFKSKLNRFQFI